MLLVVVIVAASAGLVARQLYAEPEQPLPEAVLPSDGSVAPSAQPGPPEVAATTDATAHPLFRTVRDLLQTYFDAINAKHYDQWRTTVTRKRILNQPEHKWRSDYRSTQDGSIVLYRIETGPERSARVLLAFTSTQDPQDAPLELPERCIRWKVVFPLTMEGGDWKLDAGPTSASPQHDKC